MPNFKKNTSPVMKRSGFRMAGWSGYQNSPMQQDKGLVDVADEQRHTQSGLPENLYDVDGNVRATINLDEGNLSEIKIEEDSNREYVQVRQDSEKHEEGTRFYIKP